MHRPIALAFGAAFAAIGVGAVVAPKLSAGQYGLPSDDPEALAFVRAMGTRDLAIGGMLIANRDDRAAVARILLWSVPIAVGDAVTVAVKRGWQPQLAVHGAGVVGLLAAGLLIRKPAES